MTDWESMWTANGGLQKGQAFDAAMPAPVLVQLCENGSLGGGQDKRAFVPGCGRGYAVAQLATVFPTAIGLDVAPSAVESAIENISVYDRSIQERCSFVCGDFFSFEPEDKFDCSYDYTFLCALPPGLRKDWAATHARLLKPTGTTMPSRILDNHMMLWIFLVVHIEGELLVMIFPICDKEGGIIDALASRDLLFDALT